MTENDADTVTPLDVAETDTGENFANQAGNVSPEDYETRGQTTVATRRGYAFVPRDKDVPLITHEGVKVTADQAKELVEESEGLVEIVDDNDEEKE